MEYSQTSLSNPRRCFLSFMMLSQYTNNRCTFFMYLKSLSRVSNGVCWIKYLETFDILVYLGRYFLRHKVDLVYNRYWQNGRQE